jgi:hypothetical protein
MSYSAAETESAIEATSRLLNDLGLGACRYALQPQAESWLVQVECSGARQSILAEHHLLYASLDDSAAYEHLRRAWSVALADCLRAIGQRR